MSRTRKDRDDPKAWANPPSWFVRKYQHRPYRRFTRQVLRQVCRQSSDLETPDLPSYRDTTVIWDWA